MKNPFAKGNVTKLKMVLPISKKKAWKLIATPKGLASWFPTVCKGRVAPGQTLEFGWPGGDVERFQVLRVGEAGSVWHMSWWKTGKVRYALHGREPTHFTLEVQYPRSARHWQSPELVGWTFFMSNLKSVAMGGPDLRNKNPRFSWKKGYID